MVHTVLLRQDMLCDFRFLMTNICSVMLKKTEKFDMANAKKEIAPADFARLAARYFKDCDKGRATAACRKCDASFGDDICASCDKKRMKPYTVSGLCLALGITKRRFAVLKNDKSFAEAVEMALLKIEAYIEENCISGDISGTLALALLKEHFGWGEKEDIPDTITVLLSEEAKDLAK